MDRETAQKIATPPENVDKTLWLYELCRFLTQKANAVVTALFSDSPACSSTTCPEMRASEWQYLCAVHDPPKSCCAIDYCCHTLDWAANTLTSPKNFPSRLAMGSDQSTQEKQQRNLTNIFRRVYRIFAHAWFQHREMFWKVEGRTGLYILFKTVCDAYGLIPEDNYTIPPEAEGLDDSEETSSAPPIILKREASGPSGMDAENSSVIEAGDHTLSTAGTTKRHRHSPSVSATSVSTVLEESEEEESEQKEGPTRQEGARADSTTDAGSEVGQQGQEQDQDVEAGSSLSDSGDATAGSEPHATSEDGGEPSARSQDEAAGGNDGAAGSEATAGEESASASAGLAGSEEETGEGAEGQANARSDEQMAAAEKAEKQTTEEDKAGASE